MEPKYSVLTYIFDNYEIVQEVVEKDPEAEYILITDDPNLKSSTWNVVYNEELAKLPTFTKCYYVRFHPFEYVNTDVVVRIDGDIEIRKSLSKLVSDFNSGSYDRCLMLHPARNTFDSELNLWIRARGYDPAVRDRALNFMRRSGYNIRYKGMFQGCFEIVRKNELNRDINNLTYGLMQYTGGDSIDRLDQHILSFVINHYFRDKIKILPVSENIIVNGDLMQWYKHHSKECSNSKVRIEPIMFNKPCKTWND